MNTLGPFNVLWLLLGTALCTALLCWLLLWLAASRQGRRLRRLFDRSWQPVFLQPYQPGREPSSAPPSGKTP